MTNLCFNWLGFEDIKLLTKLMSKNTIKANGAQMAVQMTKYSEFPTSLSPDVI